MLPRDLTLKRGPRDTDDAISQEKPLEISNMIHIYEPNTTRGLSYFNEFGATEDSGRRTFGHLEDAYDGQWVQYLGATEVGGSQAVTGLVFDSSAGLKLTTGARIFNKQRDEIVRITEPFTSVTTSVAVGRNFGRGVAATSLWVPGDKCLILDPSFPEGFTTPEAISNAMTYKSFQMIETEEPVEVTNVERAEATRYGDPFLYALDKVMVRLQKEQEAALYYGGSVLDTSTYTHPIGATQGIDNFIASNRYSATKITRMDLFDILTEMKVNCPYQIDIHCSMQFLGMVNEWAMESSQITVPVSGFEGDGTLGFTVNKVKLAVGTFMFYEIHLLSQDENYMGDVFFIPRNDSKPNWKYRSLKGNGQDLDLRYYPIQNDAKHTHQGEIYGVYGREFMMEELWGKLEDLEFGG